MRVAIDARWVQPKLQGPGRHVINLLLGLSQRESDLEFLVFYNSPLVRKLIERAGGPFRGRFQWIRSRAQPRSPLEVIELPWLLRINKADLFHDVGGAGIWAGGLPTVVTVHELASLRFDSHPPMTKLRRTLKGAKLLIAVSQSVADEIEANFNISRPKIRVIHNGIDPWYTERVSDQEIRAMRERFKLSGRYFLCVTADRPSKNVELVQRTARAWQGPEQWVITVASPDSSARAGQEPGRVRYLDVVEDVWLRPLYAACAAVIVPSRYEGFSLPPIEALAAGSIPVVSDIPPHREMLSEVLPDDLFFDPSSQAALERALRRSLEGGDPMKASILEKFRLVGDRYSFIETAQGVQAVYREALRG